MGTRKITFNNFHKDTRANFEIFDNKLSENILNAFKKAKRKKNFTGKFNMLIRLTSQIIPPIRG